jgi:hypothetical protein
MATAGAVSVKKWPNTSSDYELQEIIGKINILRSCSPIKVLSKQCLMSQDTEQLLLCRPLYARHEMRE